MSVNMNAREMDRRDFLGMLASAVVCAAVAPAITAAVPDQAFAAVAAGSVATYKGYTISSGNTQVYSNTGLTAKYGTIFGSDEVTLLSIKSGYTQVRYPISGGTKTGYVKTSTMLTATSGTSYTAKGKFTTYRRPGGASYGYVAKGDKVIVYGTSGSYTQIRYPVSSGYKFAWATTSDVNTYLKGASPSSSLSFPMSNYCVCGNNWGTYSANCGKAGRHYHCGIDIKSKSGNTNVFAAAAGTVVEVGWYSANGNYVVIQHTISGKTVYSFYAHLKNYCVKKNAQVSAGTKIGVMGNTGSASMGAHLHFAFASARKPGSYFGYVPKFSGAKTTYSGVTYYNPHYVIANKKLP